MIPVAKSETLTNKAPEKTNETTQGQDPTQRLFDAAHPHFGSIQPLYKPGDPPSFLNLVAPHYGSWAQPEKPRAGAVIDDATVRTTTAAAAPESDPAMAQKSNIDLLSNSKVSSEDKIRAVDALYRAGTREVTLADGRHYSLREGDLGSGHMVHLFSDGPDGKQHIVLRGVMGADGKTVEHETGHNGRQVNLEGDWWSRHMAGQTPFAVGNSENFEFGSQPRRSLAFAPTDQPEDKGRPRPLAFKPGPEGDPDTINFDPTNKDGDASPLIRQQMAQRAYEYMQANPSTVGRHGFGNCSRIARQMYHDFGLNLDGPTGDGMSGVHQGQYLESTGLFRRVSKEDAGPGDYVYRHWASRPGDLGDSCIVTGRDQRGNVYAVSGAVRHPFVVNTHNGYYTPEIYLRPTAKYEEYMRKKGLIG